jgi:hypothetical protein
MYLDFCSLHVSVSRYTPPLWSPTVRDQPARYDTLSEWQ